MWVHHNYFHDFTSPGVNGAETIRFGLSGLSLSDGFGIIEYNLFVRATGENEMLSIKASANIIRYNVLLESPGAQITLRHGNENQVYGNVLKGTDGIRIFGDRQQVFSNYLEGNTGGINIGNGDGEVADGAPLTSHDRPDDCVISFNTLVNNTRNYYMTGRTNGLGAINTTFANNIIVGGGAAASLNGVYTGGVWSGEHHLADHRRRGRDARWHVRGDRSAARPGPARHLPPAGRQPRRSTARSATIRRSRSTWTVSRAPIRRTRAPTKSADRIERGGRARCSSRGLTAVSRHRRDFGSKKRSVSLARGAYRGLHVNVRRTAIMRIRFEAMPTDTARAYQAGGLDAYGRPPERRTADSQFRVPCRHCLSDVAPGEEYLILAYRPFTTLQPYTETGPIFLHARACERHAVTEDLPDYLRRSTQMIVRGYSADERIVYGTGAVVATDRIADTASSLLAREDVAFVHVRSATNNCFQCRIDRSA